MDDLQKTGLKPCPFCGGKANVIKDGWVNPNGFSWGSNDGFAVKCLSCSSKTGRLSFKHFNKFSKFTVEDFRNNNALRAKEEDRYDEYVKTYRNKAALHWNKRATNKEI